MAARRRASMNLNEIVRRGRAMRAFCEGVRARGDVALVEEQEDLPVLRVWFRIALATEGARPGRSR